MRSLEGMMTHFASSGNYEKPPDRRPARCISTVCSSSRCEQPDLTPRYVHPHVEHHPARVRPPEAWGNLVRPGHAIYGYISPRGRGSAPIADCVKPALTWKAACSAVKD